MSEVYKRSATVHCKDREMIKRVIQHCDKRAPEEVLILHSARKG
jgi:hypothetical protein